MPSFSAPEVLGPEKYDKSCDMWSLGVIMYILWVESISVPSTVIFRFYLQPTRILLDCVDIRHSIQTMAYHCHREWENEYGMANMNFQILSGHMCQRKVIVLYRHVCSTSQTLLPTLSFFLNSLAKQLIRQLLKTDPTERMAITEFMKQPWISVSINILQFSALIKKNKKKKQ